MVPVIFLFAVIGADGFLGSYLIRSILDNTEDNVLAFCRGGDCCGTDTGRVIPCSGDLLDKAYRLELTYKINSIPNTHVLYTAAVSNIDFAAQDREKSERLNVGVLREITSSLTTCGCFLFTSSDAVYGEGGDYRFRETDRPNPLSVYAEQKLSGEAIASSIGGTSLRMPLMFSKSLSPRKKHFCDTVTENLRSGRETQLITGGIRSTLDYKTAASLMVSLCLLGQKLPGIINIAGDAPFSRYELGLFLAKSLGMPEMLIVPVSPMGQFREGAVRPNSTLMDNTLLKKILGRRKIEMKL